MEVPIGDTYEILFTTRNFSTGAPFTLGGTPAISVYEEANTTQITAGVSLSADYDSVTGLNQVAIVASSANGYEVGKYYSVVITTGTVNSVSVVGEVVGHFRVMPAEDAGAGIRDMNVTHFGDTAGTFSGGRPEVNTTHAAGTAWGSGAITAASIASSALTDAKFAADAITAAKVAADVGTEIAAAVWAAATRTLSANTNLNDLDAAGVRSALGLASANLDTQLAAIAADCLPLTDGTAQGGTGTTIQLAAASAFADDILNGCVVEILSGTGAGQARVITDYVNSTDTATVTPAWTTNPSSDSVYRVSKGSVNISAAALQAVTSAVTAADVADAVWDEPRSGHTTSGTYGQHTGDAAMRGTDSAYTGTPPTAAAIADQVWEEAIADHSGTAGSTAEALGAAGSAGDPWTTALPGSYTGSQAGKILADVLTDTGTTLPASLAALNDISAADVWAAATRTLTANTNLNDPTADAIADAVWDELRSGHTTAGTFGQHTGDAAMRGTDGAYTGTPPTTGEITAAILAMAVEGSLTFENVQRILLAAAAGKSNSHESGTPKYRNQADSKDRISATTDANGNRTAVTLDGT